MITLLIKTASIYNISPALLIAICSVESNLTPGAINHNDGGRASYGICQLQLRTARHIDSTIKVVKLLDPEVNAALAARYISAQLERYPGDLECAIAAYNAGSCRKNTEGKILNERYVRKVKKRYKKYQFIYGDDRRPIYARNREDSLKVFFRGHQNDKTKDVIQSPGQLAGDEGLETTIQSGN